MSCTVSISRIVSISINLPLFPSENLTGEIERDCMVSSRQLIPGEYETCSRNRCNDFNFPRDRLQCQKCHHCTDDVRKDPSHCRLYFKYHSACISYIDRESNEITRGCQTDWSDSHCDKGSERCVYCMYNNCNKDPRERKIQLKCYSCEREDPDCYVVQDYTRIVSFAVRMAMGKAFYCWTVFAGVNKGVVFRFHEFTRTFNQYFSMFCGRKAGPQCVRCMGNLCNMHFEYGQCYECLEGNPGCNHEGNKLTPVSCENNYVDNFGCYGLLMENERIDIAPLRRGCISDLDFLLQKSCAESQSCFFCRSQYCNMRVMSCFKCQEIINSTEFDFKDEPDNVTTVSCLRKKPEERWEIEICGSGDSCYLRIESQDENHTFVERGCMGGNQLNAVEELFNPATYQLCEDETGDWNCNEWEALNNTHSCYNINDTTIKCQNATNRCFMAYYLTAKGGPQYAKGCYNPLNKFQGDQVVCDQHIRTCEICSGSLCNFKAPRVKMNIRCQICNDRQACMFYNPTRKSVKCKGYRNYFESETCFYGLDSVSKNITRGCTMLAYPGRKTPPVDLLYCPSSGCNSPSVNDYYCYQCDSNSPYAAPGFCFKVTGEQGEVILRTARCLGGPSFLDSEKGCYTYYTPTKVLKRGCIRHLTRETIYYCEMNQTYCKLCYTEGCNDVNANGVPGFDSLKVCFNLIIFWMIVVSSGPL